MNTDKLKFEIKQIALEMGAKLVGIGSAERLKDAPPSADMNYCLPGAKSCIIWVYPFSFEAIKNYLAKKERISLKKEMYFAYSTAWKTAQKIAEFIENESSYKALALIPNGRYRQGGVGANTVGGRLKMRAARFLLRLGIGGNIIAKNIAKIFGKEMIYPEFSLRYGAVAAGLGHIGWSGNLVTKEYGGAVLLGGVLTTAPLEPDPMAEENYCSRCKLCVKVCNSGFFSMNEEEPPVIIGGQKEVYSKRNLFARCGIGCSGWTGLSKEGTWSIWSPNHISLANVEEEKIKDEQYRIELLKTLLFSKETPENIRNFNKKILIDLLEGGVFVNVGLRTLEATNPRCGFCSFICVSDIKQHKELYDLLQKSGKMFVDEEGKEYIKAKDESGKEIKYYPPLEV